MRPRNSALAAGGAGLLSLAVTAGFLMLGAESPAPGWTVGESAVLLGLIVLAVRTAPHRAALAAAALAGVAAPVSLLRYGPAAPTVEALAGFAVWGLAAALAATIGLYLRSLDDHRARAVQEARREQRVHLARDLHDFVAHDVSGMLAQAQAGRILAESDPRQAAAAFERIEQAALQALTSMDRTVRMLHDTDDPAGRAPLPALADLRELADRFSSSGTAAVRLDLDAGDVPREVAATAYRIVVEALTNVRRHATAARQVEVAVHHTGSALEVTVTDDGTGPAQRRPGFGLSGLAERVEALGGGLTAGPHSPRGWRLAATIPLGAA
ncbi:sensor histidine kinase [Herbidospora cretacea]|uniref:sensor histidine kinase n=1 Tax=Herbidospora cretacea TaxID=28444 RepID=UPI000774310B|nr:histidine kinase [Herbidospora cretacea]